MDIQKVDHTKFPVAGDMASQISFLLRYAVRAPSTHNIQPWKFMFDQHGVTVLRDTDPLRFLPEGDVTGRDAYISVGACTEHLVLAAKYFGMFESCSISTGKNANEVYATVYLHPYTVIDQSLTETMTAIEQRFNARGIFEARLIPRDVLHGLALVPKEKGLQLTILEGDKKHVFADLTRKGMHVFHSRKAFTKELSGWMRSNYSAKKDGIPGYSMLAPGPISLILPWIIRTFNMGGILGALNNKSIMSAPCAGVISSADDTPLDWVNTGRYYERLSLYLATKHVRTSVYVAAVEWSEARTTLQAITDEHSLPQFSFTFGYPTIVLRQSPRLDPDERMA